MCTLLLFPYIWYETVHNIVGSGTRSKSDCDSNVDMAVQRERVGNGQRIWLKRVDLHKSVESNHGRIVTGNMKMGVGVGF